MHACLHSRRITLLGVSLLAAMMSAVADASASPAATGRWKIDGPNCYWDPNDEGLNQCDPNHPPGGYTYDSNGYCNWATNVFSSVCTPTGRYKTDRRTCWWVATESGPNQCNPNAPPGGYAIDANGYCNTNPNVFGDTCAPTGQYRTDGVRCWWAEEYSGPNQCDPGNLPRPAITLTAPVSGVVLDAPVTATLAATASSSPGWVVGVEFYANGSLVGVDTTAPYTVTWAGAAVGSYTITARAVNSYGMATWSAAASITVSPGVEYYHLDALGSVRAATDKNGSILRRNDYFPFGEADTPPPGAATLGFTGQEGDPETGLSYFDARYYRTRTGRFTTPDPIIAGLVDPQRWNRYAYALNNPLSRVDPTGMLAIGMPQSFCPAEFSFGQCGGDAMFWDTSGGGGGGGGGFEFGGGYAQAQQRGYVPGMPIDMWQELDAWNQQVDDAFTEAVSASTGSLVTEAGFTIEETGQSKSTAALGNKSDDGPVVVLSAGGAFVPFLGADLSGGFYYDLKTGEWGIFGSRSVAVGIGIGLGAQGGFVNSMSNFKGSAVSLEGGIGPAWFVVTRDSTNTFFTGFLGGSAVPIPGQMYGAYVTRSVTTVFPLGTLGSGGR